jgi:hypothetical protein
MGAFDAECSIRQGNLSMLRGTAMRASHVVLTLAAFCAAGCGGGQPLKPYRSDAFAFSADLPGEPEAVTATVPFMNEQSLPSKEFTAKSGNTTYMVVVTKEPDKKKYVADTMSLLFDMQREIQTRTASEAIEGKEIFHQEKEARDILLGRPDKTKYTRARLLVLRPYCYRFIVMGSKSDVESKAATQFLDSARALGGGPTTDDPQFAQIVPNPPTPPTGSAAATKPSGSASLSDVKVEPQSSGSTLKTKKWRVDDLDVTALNVDQKDILPSVVWSADGKSLYLLSKNAGVLHKVTLDGLVEDARLEIGRPCAWLALSSAGLVVAVPDLQEVWVVDPSNLTVVKKVASDGVTRVVSSPTTSLAFATAPKPNGLVPDRVEMLDLEAGSSIGVIEANSLGKQVGFGFTQLSPDGKFLYTLGKGESIQRFKVDSGALALDATGPRIGQNPQDLVLSRDGNLIALPSAGGNYVPDGHPQQKHGTYLYKPSDLSSPVSVIESGSYPRAIGFDIKNDLVYTQSIKFDLLTFKTDGTKVKEYSLSKGRDAVGTPKTIAPQPDGEALLYASDQGVFLIAPAVGPAPVDETAKAKEDSASKKKRVMNKPAMPRPTPKSKSKGKTPN